MRGFLSKSMLNLTSGYPFKVQVYYILAWEPRAAQITKSFSRRLPALKRFNWEHFFRY